jgi:hypothetical protein
MLASAETREEVVEQLRRDTYFRSGVWDWEKVVIYPVSVFRALFGGWGVGGRRGRDGACTGEGFGLGWADGVYSSRVRFGRNCEGWGWGGAEWFVSVGVVFAWLGDDGLEYRGLGTFLYTYIYLYTVGNMDNECKREE